MQSPLYMLLVFHRSCPPDLQPASQTALTSQALHPSQCALPPWPRQGKGSLEIQALTIPCFGKEVTQAVSRNISLVRTGPWSAKPQEGGKVHPEVNEPSTRLHERENFWTTDNCFSLLTLKCWSLNPDVSHLGAPVAYRLLKSPF